MRTEGTEKTQLDKYGNSLSRYIKVKEEHAEIVKKEIDILWHDYFRPEHLEKYPDLHTKFWNATKLASRNKQNVDKALRRHNKNIAEMQLTQKRAADIAIDLYAIACCLSRTTRAAT